MRSRGWLQRHGVQSADISQVKLQRMLDAQEALGQGFRLVGMRIEDTLDPRHRLVEAGLYFIVQEPSG